MLRNGNNDRHGSRLYGHPATDTRCIVDETFAWMTSVKIRRVIIIPLMHILAVAPLVGCCVTPRGKVGVVFDAGPLEVLAKFGVPGLIRRLKTSTV